MLILYAVPHSLYCAKTRILLRAKGLEWEERMPADDRVGFAAASPFGNLPAIVDGDFGLSDSEAIAEYIEEVSPSVATLPLDVRGRARMRERARFHDTRLEPAVRALFPLVAAPDAAKATHATAAISARLAQLAELLVHPLPFGLGDCGFAPTFLWIDLLTADSGLTPDWPDAVRTYRKALEALPCVTEELAAYRPAALEWLIDKQMLRARLAAAGG